MKGLIDIIVNPNKVFSEERRPWAPFLATVIISLLYYLSIQLLLRDQILAKSLEYISNLPEEQKERALAMINSHTRLIFGAISILIIIPIKILLQSAIYHFVAPVFEGNLSFKNSLTLLSYANFVSSLSAIVKLPLALLTGDPFVRTDLGFLFPDLKGYMGSILSQIDLFTIWSLYILAMGIEKYGKVKKNVSYLLVAILWLVYILVIFPTFMARRSL